MPTIQERLQQWQQELLDFSNRNRLLNFRPSTTRPSSIELIAPDPDAIYEALLQGKSLTVVGNDPEEDDELIVSEEEEDGDPIPSDAIDDTDSDQLRAGTALSRLPTERTNHVLLRLLTRARASEQELGINTLFAVFGLLKWQERAGSDSWQYAPLVMLPLTIEERTREGNFRVAPAGDDPEFNQTVAERLRRDFGLELGVEIDEETAVAAVFSIVREAVSRRPGWEVLEQVHLGHFQFYKLRMFADLLKHASLAADHEIVQALGSDLATITALPEGVPSEEELDRAVLPEDSFTILDADASQLRAIQAAVRGAHLIIQGPPGTGKSQTITNIIAECIAAGQTVLFVSEKAAAIDVVHRRLAARGLSEFCLMLHSHKANKREIIAELGSRLEDSAVPPTSPQERLLLQSLQEHRLDLNAYANALHRIREPLGETVYWVHGELSGLDHVPLLLVDPPTNSTLTHADLDRLTRILSELSAHVSVLTEGPAHPWAGAKVVPLSLTDRQRLKDLLGSLVPLVQDLRRTGANLASKLGLPAPATISELAGLAFVAGRVLSADDLRGIWFEEGRVEEAARLVAEARSQGIPLHQIEARLLALYDPSVFEIDPDEAIRLYEQNLFVRLFSSSYRNLCTRVRAATRGGEKRSTQEDIAAFHEARARRQHLSWFQDHEPATLDLLGVDAQAAARLDEDAWKRLEANVTVAAQIIDRFGPKPVPTDFVQQACRKQLATIVSDDQRQLQTGIDRFNQQMSVLSQFFEDGAFPPVLEGELEGLERLLVLRASRLDDLDRWVQAQRALQRAVAAGLATIEEDLFKRNVPPRLWAEAFRRLVLTSWLDRTVQDDPILQNFNRFQQDQRVSQFVSLDREYLQSTDLRARRARLEKRGRVTAAYGGEPQVLRFEAQKRKRHMPLRRLFERIPNLLPTLKPCLMMSPLSVAQYLPADLYHFDLVIFDEASQVRPHDAIGAIMRGKRLVVAGDSKQLPPTAFFDRVTEDGEVDEGQDLRALESILDALNGKGMPAMRLLWHYRSRHEDLIAYSNHHFYDGSLITFPTPSPERSPSRGVRLEFVADGRYEDERDRVLKTPIKVNRIEAKWVAELVMGHARSRPDESLLVVTLGMNQRDVVEEEIKRARLLEQDLEPFFDTDKPEPFFVKALEQVQGDERDTILISVGYGKNPAGVLSHNFGPINQQGGERRLNVLVTRARNQVVLVSSIRFTDIDLTKTQNRGPQLLRNYLEFAERGRDALAILEVTGGGEYESPFEEQVGEALKRAGFTIHSQVGSSKYRIDMAIVDPRHPDRFILAVECDGKTYHQSKTARDRDRLRQEVLEGLGWSIHRIWSTEWLRHPDRELERVIARVEELMSNGRPPPRLPPSQPSVSQSAFGASGVPDDVVPPPDQDAMSTTARIQDENIEVVENRIGVPFREADLPSPDQELWDTPASVLTDAVVQCIDVEGPVHHDVLLRRITGLWGYQRAGSRIARLVDAAIAAGVQRGRIRRVGEFLWPTQTIELVPRGASPDGTLREISHVPDEEIARAITEILERALSLSPDDLIVQSSRVFGFQRAGQDIRARVLDVARGMYKAGIVDFKGGRVQLGRS